MAQIPQQVLIKLVIVFSCIISAGILAYIGVEGVIDGTRFLKEAEPVVAKVTEVTPYEGTCGSGSTRRACTLFRSKVEFTNRLGEETGGVIERKLIQSSQVNLLYNPKHPKTLELEGYSPWEKSLLFFVIAILEICVVLPVVLFFISRKQQTRKTSSPISSMSGTSGQGPA
jgi:hypothetical protein